MPTMQHIQAIIEQGIAQGLHLGAVVYVSIAGQATISLAVGQAQSGISMRPDTLLPWMSSGKPLSAVMIGLLLDEGLLTLDDPVTRFIPEFAGGRKHEIRIRHLLNHTAGLQKSIAGNMAVTDWQSAIDRVCAYELEDIWMVGHTAGYDPGASWFILGQIIQKVTGKPFAEAIRQRVLTPLGMLESSFAMSADRYRTLGERVGHMFNTQHTAGTANAPRDCGWDSETNVQFPRPGASARGPVYELARFYEGLLQGRLLKPQTLQLLVSPSRGICFDKTFGRELDWGLGFMVDNGPDAPYSAGSFANPTIFSHGGQQSSLAFADPSRQLVAAAVFNGLCGEARHQIRLRGLTEAIRLDAFEK